MLTFTLLRLPYLRLDAVLSRSISPGDWFYYRTGWYRFAIALHLSTILPVGILMIPQFLPLLRSTNRLLRFHKLNGYTIWALVCLGNIGALMIMPRAFGGGVDSQSIVVVLVVLTQTGVAMAWYNMRRYQLDQHRAWDVADDVLVGGDCEYEGCDARYGAGDDVGGWVFHRYPVS